MCDGVRLTRRSWREECWRESVEEKLKLPIRAADESSDSKLCAVIQQNKQQTVNVKVSVKQGWHPGLQAAHTRT